MDSYMFEACEVGGALGEGEGQPVVVLAATAGD